MKEVVFITDADTDLGKELVNIYLENDFYVFGTVSQSDDVKEKINIMYDFFNSFKNDVKFEIWNRKSPASSKGILLKALTSCKELKRIVLLGNPVFLNLNLQDIDFGNIELNIDSYIKGNLYLLKESFKYFKERNNPSDFLVLVNLINNNPHSLLDEIVGNSFSGVIRSLLVNNKEETINICSFESKSKKIEEFAGYIYRLLENKNKRVSGRVFKFTGGVIR